jgi:hypothetical protein
MNKDDKVFVKVNGIGMQGTYMHPIRGKKNRHCVAVKRDGWRRDHWVTVSTKKLAAA